MKQKLSSFIIVVLTLLLASCGNMSSNYQARNNRYPLTAAQYLQQADKAQGTDKQAFLLKAVGRYIQDNQLLSAQALLNKMNGQVLPDQERAEQQLLQASLYLKSNQAYPAINTLTSLNDEAFDLNQQQQIDLHTLLAQAYQKTGKIIKSINQRDTLNNLLTDKQAQQQNLADIWQSLQNFSTQTLSNLVQQTPDARLRGWFDLALITKQSQTPSQLLESLSTWREQFPNHPAQSLLPSNLKYHAKQSTMPKQVALLLPLSGKYASAGEAIRNGFLAAYYSSKKQGRYTPTVRIYNSNTQNIQAVYQKAVQQGANFVVGPLNKNQVEQLANTTKISVPTLALNHLPDNQSSPSKQFYQFGLSPIDEARQAAQRAWNQHLSHALIIAPDSDWGKNVANAFMQQWQMQGGQIMGQMYYTEQQKLADQIKHLMNLDLANKDYLNVRWMMREKVRFIPRRRKDIDVIFLVAQPKYARQIRPLLRFYYAGSIPIYSTSQVFTGRLNPSRDRDLDGVIFPDIPWVIHGSQETPELANLRKQIQATWASSYNKNIKLYALGVDAYNIINKLNQMALLPQFGISGATGTLYLDQQQQIYRQLLWSKMVNGKPKLDQ